MTAVRTASRGRTGAPTGIVYLVHFTEPYRHARHYTGWTADLDSRLAEHQAGRGARLLQVITQAGIDWTLARTWQGTRERERQLKRQGGASRRCPICRAERERARCPTTA
jgi:predicted GIY-YIG superfamily endonuclease